MVDAQKVQWAGYAVAAVLVVVLGATYLRSGGGGTAGAAGAGASRTAPVKVTQGRGTDVVVDVTGAVRRPGVYRLPSDQRVQDAVRRAGGPTRRAELAAVNLAARLTDGAQILVPVRAVAGGGGVAAAGGTAATPAGPVNLNTATPEQLDGLDGIGPTTAQKIVEYRKEHGGFGSLQDLDRIPGIGPKRLAALKGKVTP